MNYDPPLVERIHTASGSHIEPPLNPRWPDLKKLRWQAAVVAIDSGVVVRIDPAGYIVNGIRRRGHFNASALGSTLGPMTFDHAWSFLNGVEFGARLVRAG